MPARKRTAKPAFTRIYSWTPERKATRGVIAYFVAEAIDHKLWATQVTKAWRDGASKMSLDLLDEYLTWSVHRLARKALDYARLRAFMTGAYEGYPGDKPARDLWHKLLPLDRKAASALVERTAKPVARSRAKAKPIKASTPSTPDTIKPLAGWDRAYKAPAPIIAYYVRKAHHDRLWAADLAPAWFARATASERERATFLRDATVREIARAAIDERRLVEAEAGCVPADGYSVIWDRYRAYGGVTREAAIAAVIAYEPGPMENVRPSSLFSVVGREVYFEHRLVATLSDTMSSAFEDYFVQTLYEVEIGAVPEDRHEREMKELRDGLEEDAKEQDEKIKDLEEAKDRLDAELDAIEVAGSGSKRLRELMAERDLQKARADALSNTAFAQRGEIAQLTAKLADARRSLREASPKAAPKKGPVLRVVQGGRQSA